jgi:carboxypeptidase T
MIEAVRHRGSTFLTAAITILVVAGCGSPLPSPTSPPTVAASTASSPESSTAALVPPTASPTTAVTPVPSPSPMPQPRSTSSPVALPHCPAETDRFPVGYAAYHTYAGLCRALVVATKAHPRIARLFSIGRSWQGRMIWAMEISTHLTDGTHPPGVLFDGLHHGLEHLSLEMTIGIMGWLLDGYGHDAPITRLVASRAIFIIFDVNPDGAAADIAGARFHTWRKNRQPGPGGAVGTDLNRNYADHWGCCGLVSSKPLSPYYRGTGPFSAPETRAVRDFVLSRIFNGRQQIRVAITFHSSGRLILWPYGYTATAVPSDMRPDDHAVFVAMGRAMARDNGYRPEQASGLYIDSGTARDWYYGRQRIFAYTFELGAGLYQRSAAIAPEVARNRSAVLYLIGLADCPYRAIGKAARYCAQG